MRLCKGHLEELIKNGLGPLSQQALKDNLCEEKNCEFCVVHARTKVIVAIKTRNIEKAVDDAWERSK